MKGYIKDSKKILFEGNGYSDEWKEEAAKRGLSNVASTPEALKAILNKDYIEIFERLGILTEREFHARYEMN